MLPQQSKGAGLAKVMLAWKVTPLQEERVPRGDETQPSSGSYAAPWLLSVAFPNRCSFSNAISCITINCQRRPRPCATAEACPTTTTIRFPSGSTLTALDIPTHPEELTLIATPVRTKASPTRAGRNGTPEASRHYYHVRR